MHAQLVVKNMNNDEETSRCQSLGRRIWVIHRHSQAWLDRELDYYGIGCGQLRFLMELYLVDGINQEQLSERLRVDKGTTARAVKKLEELGYLQRSRDPEDRRVYRLQLTPAGKELGPVVRETRKKLTERLTAGFSEGERETLRGLLDRVVHNIAGDIGGECCD